LKTAQVIPRSKFDFPTAISPVVAVRQHLGRKSLQRRVGKTNRRHRAAQMRRAARGNRQRRKFSSSFQQRQIIGRIHLHTDLKIAWQSFVKSVKANRQLKTM
jgi:hypothetical protein